MYEHRIAKCEQNVRKIYEVFENQEIKCTRRLTKIYA